MSTRRSTLALQAPVSCAPRREKLDVDMQNAYELTMICDVTGSIGTLSGPYMSSVKIAEEKELYDEYIPSNATILITIRNNTKTPLTCREKVCITKTKHNPFDTKFKICVGKPAHHYGEKDYYKDIEKAYINRSIAACATTMYERNMHIKPRPELIGSLWHIGYVNVLFGKKRCSYYKIVWKWMDIIGKKYTPKSIDELYDANLSGIYANNIDAIDIDRLCEYCYRFFNVNIYEVAWLFTKRDIYEFDTRASDGCLKESKLVQVSETYADTGDIDMIWTYHTNLKVSTNQ